MHDADALDLIFAHYRNIVFRLAGDDAGRASSAGIEIDGHAPGVLAARPLFPKVGQLFMLAFKAAQLLHADLLNNRAALHGEMLLRGAQVLFPSGLLQGGISG